MNTVQDSPSTTNDNLRNSGAQTLEVVAAERIVRWAEVAPSVGRRECRGGVHILGEDDREAGLQVEVDVAVEEPGARVVRLNARTLISLIRFMREGKRDIP